MTTATENEAARREGRDAGLTFRYSEREYARQQATLRGPRVGEGATHCIGSDRYAVTITAVSRTAHKVVADGATYTRRRDGRYRPQGCSYGSLVLGVSENYLDPHF